MKRFRICNIHICEIGDKDTTLMFAIKILILKSSELVLVGNRKKTEVVQDKKNPYFCSLKFAPT